MTFDFLDKVPQALGCAWQPGFFNSYQLCREAFHLSGGALIALLASLFFFVGDTVGKWIVSLAGAALVAIILFKEIANPGQGFTKTAFDVLAWGFGFYLGLLPVVWLRRGNRASTPNL